MKPVAKMKRPKRKEEPRKRESVNTTVPRREKKERRSLSLWRRKLRR